MNIVPSGKIRLLRGQRIEEPITPGLDNGVSNDISMGEDLPQDVPDVSSVDNSIQTEVPQEDTLTGYIFKKLQEFGYPGRRLDEFKKKFVSEDISPDGTKNKVVEIPDKYYPGQDGITKTVEDSDVSNIAKEIQQKFGLHFNGAKRSDGKWSISFTSANVQKDEEAPIADNLDEVYGNPLKGDKGRRRESVKASTLGELMKESKDNVFDKLNKIINGEIDAS